MRRRKRAGARPPTRLSPGAAARQGPIPEDFSGEVLPSRSPNRPVRSRWHSRRSDIMPFSLEISQTRYTVPGLRRVGRPCAGASRRRTAAHARAASHHQLRRRRRPPPPAESDRAAPLRQHRRSPAPIAAPAAVVAAAAAAAARPPQARPHAYAHASARAAPRRAALTARRRLPSRAIAARRAVRRRAARAGPRRARRPRAPARESGRHRACGAAVETNLVTFTSAIGGVRNALAPPHRVRTSRRARRALASTRRPPPPVAQIAGSVSARGVMSSTADLRSRSGRPVDDDDLCTAVAAVEPMRDLLEGLPHVWGGSPLGRPQFGALTARRRDAATSSRRP